MNCKLENDKEQRFRKTIIYGIIRDYGAPQTALMCGLREDQTDLIYKYSNQNNNLDVPDKRWRVLSQSLTKQGDKRIIREYAHPEVQISITHSDATNGRLDDELDGILIRLGKIKEIVINHEDEAGPLECNMIASYVSEISDLTATMKSELK